MSVTKISEGAYSGTIHDLNAEVVDVQVVNNKHDERRVELTLEGERVVSRDVRISDYGRVQLLAIVRFTIGQEVQFYFEQEFPVRVGHKLVFRFVRIGDSVGENVLIVNRTMNTNWSWKGRPTMRFSGPADAKPLLAWRRIGLLSLLLGGGVVIWALDKGGMPDGGAPVLLIVWAGSSIVLFFLLAVVRFFLPKNKGATARLVSLHEFKRKLKAAAQAPPASA